MNNVHKTYHWPNHRTEIISVVYRPPSGKTEKFFDKLKHALDFIQNEKANAETIILGDINIDYKLRHTINYKQIKEFEREYQLKQLITNPTHITPGNSSVLDMIFTDIENIQRSRILDNALSDHLPVFVTKKKQKIRKNNTKMYTKGRSYTFYKKESFQLSIQNDKRWHNYWMPNTDPDTLWQIMFQILKDAADHFSPIVNMKDWFSHELQEIHYEDDYSAFIKTVNSKYPV